MSGGVDEIRPYTREELAHLEWRFIEAQRSVDLVDLNIDEKEVARLLATARAGLEDTERLGKLSLYAKHPNHCRRWWHHQIEGSILYAPSEEHPCTCGLDALLERNTSSGRDAAKERT